MCYVEHLYNSTYILYVYNQHTICYAASYMYSRHVGSSNCTEEPQAVLFNLIVSLLFGIVYCIH